MKLGAVVPLPLSSYALTTVPAVLLLPRMKLLTAANVVLLYPGSLMEELLPLTPTMMSFELAGSPLLKLLPVMEAQTSMSSALEGAPAARANPANGPGAAADTAVFPVMVRLTS